MLFQFQKVLDRFAVFIHPKSLGIYAFYTPESLTGAAIFAPLVIFNLPLLFIFIAAPVSRRFFLVTNILCANYGNPLCLVVTI